MPFECLYRKSQMTERTGAYLIQLCVNVSVSLCFLQCWEGEICSVWSTGISSFEVFIWVIILAVCILYTLFATQLVKRNNKKNCSVKKRFSYLHKYIKNIFYLFTYFTWCTFSFSEGMYLRQFWHCSMVSSGDNRYANSLFYNENTQY